MQRLDPRNTPPEGSPESRILQAAQEQNLNLRLATFPNDSHTWYLLGRVLSNQGRYVEAEKALRKAVTLNPAPDAYWTELAKVLKLLGSGDLSSYELRDLVRSQQLSSEDSILDELLKTKEDHTIRKGGPIRRIIADDTSPCVTCADYTYYGCTRHAACEALLKWRASRL